MAKGKTTHTVEVRSLNSLYNYLRREVKGYKHLQTKFFDSELALILDKEIGLRGYEQGTARPNEDSFVIGYFGMRDNARETFSHSQSKKYDITRRLQNKVNESLKSGERYRKKGYEQISIEEVKADMQAVRDFFKFLLTAFKEKLQR